MGEQTMAYSGTTEMATTFLTVCFKEVLSVFQISVLLDELYYCLWRDLGITLEYVVLRFPFCCQREITKTEDFTKMPKSVNWR